MKGPDALPAHDYSHLRRVRSPDAPDTFDFKRNPDAYEYLLLDVLLGDATIENSPPALWMQAYIA